MRHRFTLFVRGVEGDAAVLLQLYVNGTRAALWLMPRAAAHAFADALIAGHVGAEGSGAQIEIVLGGPTP